MSSRIQEAYYVWNHYVEAEVRITLSPDTQEITIVSCLLNVRDKTHTEAERAQDFVELSCVTKWQGMLE